MVFSAKYGRIRENVSVFAVGWQKGVGKKKKKKHRGNPTRRKQPGLEAPKRHAHTRAAPRNDGIEGGACSGRGETEGENKQKKDKKKRSENLIKKFSISGKLLIPIKYRNCIFYSVS